MDYEEYKNTSLVLNKAPSVAVKGFFNSKSVTTLTDIYTISKQCYWNGTAVMEDWVYDILCHFMKAKAPSVMQVIEHSTETGLPLSKKVTHKVPMLSLNKVYSIEDLVAWVTSVARTDDEEFLIQPKYDGVSCFYDSEKNQFSTRGDGFVGEDITLAMKTIGKIDHSKETNSFDILGEVLIKKSDFNTLYKNIRNAKGENFKNSRNAIAGILGTDDIDFYANQKAVIHLVDYDLYSFKAKANNFEQSFQIAKQVITNLDYPMDGIVVKLADRAYSKYLGSTAHHPKGQMAFKFQNSNAWTPLKTIEFGMGKGQLTATAVFRPISLGGVTITRAVIPIYSETLPCVKKGDFVQGCELLVERAGDVIPHIIEVQSCPGPKFDIENCPFCGSPIKIVGSSVVCTNDLCHEKLVQRLYLSLVALGIKDVGECTVRDVIDSCKFAEQEINLGGWFNYVLGKDFIRIMSVSIGYNIISAKKIQVVTEKIRTSTIDKFIASLNIPNVGIRIGKELSKLGDLNTVLNASIDTLSRINGIGSIMAERIFDYFNQNRKTILEYSKHFDFSQHQKAKHKADDYKVTEDGNGRTVCFTGAMRYRRSEMAKIASKRGFVPVDSVTKNLDILVLADNETDASSKCQKARQYGIDIIREEDFLNSTF